MKDKKLLVVDDDPNFAGLVVEYFRTLGYDARLALNLENAINVFRSQRPNVVLLDFNMPMVTGDKFVPVLQDMNPLVRIIVVTGYLQAEVEEKFKGLGYFGFFEKGDLSLENMRSKVEEALQD
jgi:DNA-binding NtrC family response regulator